MKSAVFVSIVFISLYSFCQTKDSVASFQFENSDPINYSGTEEDIIKAIEKADSSMRIQNKDTTKKLTDKVNIADEPVIHWVDGIDTSNKNETISKKDSIIKASFNNSGWGIQGVGPGWLFPMGTARQKINQGKNFNPSLLINLKRIRLMLSGSQLTGSIKDTFNYGQEYIIGRQLFAWSWELSAGYAVMQNKFVTIIPMIGTGVTHYELINPDSIIPFDKTADYWTCSFRTAVDFNIFRAFSPDKSVVGSFFIRLMGGYYPFIYQKPFRINGGAAFASISVGLQFGWLPRQKQQVKDK